MSAAGRTLRIATRKSKLAMWQAEFVKTRLERAHPGLDVELVGMTTQGDRWLSSPLSEIGGKGLFVKELEQALVDGRADIAVHSMKDVPAVLPEGFAIPVVAFREDARDVLLSRGGERLIDLPACARVGSSSLRRRAQLLQVRPDLSIQPLRGNVDTRVAKLDAGELDAIVLAAAGLERLGLGGRITERLTVDVCLPAAGQGALGIECRSDDADVQRWLAALADAATARCVAAERAVSAALGADCTLPIAAHGVLDGSSVALKALIASIDGQKVVRCEVTGVDPEAVGAEAARRLERGGGDAILKELKMRSDALR
jgi:hydroxymethylbilane synthase